MSTAKPTLVEYGTNRALLGNSAAVTIAQVSRIEQ